MSPGRESDETDTENTSNEKEKAKDSVTATNAKPPAKRRTKTGCLSKLEPVLVGSEMADLNSMSETPHQMWRGETCECASNLQ